MGESFNIQAVTFEEFWAKLIPITRGSEQAFKLAWRSARAAERETPTQNCGCCEEDKPRSSFPDSEWKKPPALKRRCTDCKRDPHSAKIDPGLTWRRMIETNFQEDQALRQYSKVRGAKYLQDRGNPKAITGRTAAVFGSRIRPSADSARDEK